MTLKIEAGKFYRTRDGLKVGPMVFGRSIRMSHDGITFRWSGDPSEHSVWADNGCYFGNSERARDHDLIEEWTDKPKALDLTAITTPDYNDGKWHGWNGGECPVHLKTRADLIAQNGSMWKDTIVGEIGGWSADHCNPIVAFRVVKPYTAPREWWIVGGREAYDSEADALGAIASLFDDGKPVHVREVTE